MRLLLKEALLKYRNRKSEISELLEPRDFRKTQTLDLEDLE